MSEENALAGSVEPVTPTDQAVSPDTETKVEAQTQETAEGSTEQPEAEKSGDDAKAEKPKPKSRAQERIEELARDRKNLRRQLTRANQEIGKLRAEQPPRREDFADEDDYHRASLKRATRETTAEQQFDAAQAEIETLASKRQETWAEIVSEAKQSMPDFESVFDASVPISDAMADLILEADNPALLAYWFGKNRSEAYRIANLPPVEAARELGRLEARIAPPTPKMFSTAPKPVTTVSGKATQSVAKNPAQLASSMDDYAAYWESREGLRK